MSDTLSSELTHLLTETLNLAAETPTEGRGSWELHRTALIHEAARALRTCLGGRGNEGQGEEGGASEERRGESADERLWNLTKLATAIGARQDVPGALNEAVAALQEASCLLAQP